jgi:hypothetical protein
MLCCGVEKQCLGDPNQSIPEPSLIGWSLPKPAIGATLSLQKDLPMFSASQSVD